VERQVRPPRTETSFHGPATIWTREAVAPAFVLARVPAELWSFGVDRADRTQASAVSGNVCALPAARPVACFVFQHAPKRDGASGFPVPGMMS
jgi:hypothetical protein